jgi:hypothetical protein
MYIIPLERKAKVYKPTLEECGLNPHLETTVGHALPVKSKKTGNNKTRR